jgi:hypothetical protein
MKPLDAGLSDLGPVLPHSHSGNPGRFRRRVRRPVDRVYQFAQSVPLLGPLVLTPTRVNLSIN